MKREQFLSRVSAALRDADLPATTGPAVAPTITFVDPVERFIEAATAVDATVVRVEDVDGAIAAVEEQIPFLARPAGDLPPGFIAWDDVEVIVPGLFDRLVAIGWERVDATIGPDSRTDDHARIGDATVGITGADVGVAATGSLVLCHGPGRPRSSSLLVETHIAILPIERIVHSLDDALGQVDREDNSNIVAITGPSRTGDIESILTLGVHGPRHLHIVLVG